MGLVEPTILRPTPPSVVNRQTVQIATGSKILRHINVKLHTDQGSSTDILNTTACILRSATACDLMREIGFVGRTTCYNSCT